MLSMVGLTSPVWTIIMFQMVTGESCQCIRHTKQTNLSEVDVRHATCTVPKCCFVIRYQNTSNLDRRTNHFNLVDGLRKSSVNWSGKVWTEHVGMGELEGSLCYVERSLWQHVTHARHPVPYIQSCQDGTSYTILKKTGVIFPIFFAQSKYNIGEVLAGLVL